MADRRALIVGARAWLDPALPDHPGVTPLLRRLAQRLAAGGITVRALLDDAPDDRHRPLLANLLDGLTWLAASPEPPLLLLSGAVREGAYLPRDARASRLARTALPLAELLGELPPTAGVLLDCPALPDAAAGVRWAIGATAAPPNSQGPSPLLSALARRLLAAGPVGAGDLAAAARDGGGWARGDLAAPVLPDLPAAAARACPACAAPVDDPTAGFCPSCGAAVAGREALDRGRYRLLRRLGQGGMGEVFLAEDTRLKVRRAVKVLKLPEGLPPDEVDGLRARMIQEARAAQALAETSHHVVKVFDVGHDPVRGEPFLVMELLDGVTLADRLAEGPLPRAEALRVGRAMAHTLAEAHRRAVIHRDLKPENVMLVRHGGADGFVKLLDFGLAKLAQPEVHTASGRMMGTLQYMPPEQLKGERVDARADVYALGAVLYECLAGVRANPGDSQGALFAVLLDRGVTPLAEVAPQLPPALCALVDQCLALDRDARPADAGAVAQRLDQLAAGALEATVGPSEPPTQAAAPTRARPRSWIAAAALLLAGTGWALWPEPTPPAHSDAAIPDAGPVDAGVPDAAPPDLAVAGAAAPAPPTPPARWPADLSGVQVAAQEGRLQITGGSPAQRYATAAAWAGLDDPDPAARWAALADGGRAWLGGRLPPAWLTPTPDGLTIGPDPWARAQAGRPARVDLRGLGILFTDAGRLVWGRVSCGGAAAGERLFTAQWLTPGYDQGRCEGPRCAAALTRALRTARAGHEALRLTVTVGPREGETDGATRRVRCRVRP